MPSKHHGNAKKLFHVPYKSSFSVSVLKRIMRINIILTRPQKIGIVGLFLIIFGVIFQTVIFQGLLEVQIKKKTALKKGWPMREMWGKLPFPWELRVYLFNVTNPEEIANGEKPILQEVGPYVYDVWQEKTQQIDYEEDDTLSYSTKNTYFFNAYKSQGLSDEDELILPHFISLGIANGVMKVIPILLPLAEKIVDSVFENPQSVFVKMKVKIFLFDGYEISCEKPKDFFGAAFCNQMKKFWTMYRMRKKDNNVYLVSIYGSLNATDVYSGKIRMRRGSRNIKEVGDLVEYNGKKNLSIWENDECDAFVGTDGTIFHPFLNVNSKENLYVTKTFYCRVLTYHYDSDIEFAGHKLSRYTTSLGSDMETNPNENCYCEDSSNCLRKGVYELWRCINTVRIASNPHFYLADPYYVDAVEGIRPIKERHMTILDIDPLTGLAVRAHFRIQFNLLLTKLKKYRLMKDFPEALLPIMWADEVMILPDSVSERIISTYKVVTVAKIFSYLVIFKGSAICSYAIFCVYKSRKKKHSTVKTITLATNGIENKFNSTRNHVRKKQSLLEKMRKPFNK